MDFEAKVREFIQKNFYAARTGEFADDASLLDLGIVDSTGILEVIGFLETDLGVHVEDEEMVPENLDSVAAIAAFARRKKAISLQPSAHSPGPERTQGVRLRATGFRHAVAAGEGAVPRGRAPPRARMADSSARSALYAGSAPS